MADTLKVATLNVPKQDNAGNTLNYVALNVRHKFVDAFGGFTEVDATGGWRGIDGRLKCEPMRVFYVAMKDNEGNRDTLRDIAVGVAIDADQEAVYVVHAAGDVEFVPQPTKA